MAHITLNNESLPGIVGLLDYSPSTAAPLLALANALLATEDGGLTKGEKELIAASAREAGATDKNIHDAALIAAAFCMFNRYVDGLGTWAPQKNEDYLEMGRTMARYGYGRTTHPEHRGAPVVRIYHT